MDGPRRILLGVALLLGCAAPAAAQSANLKAELLKDWVDLKETMHKLADEMPADRYSFKTTPPQRDFGQQVAHISGANLLNLAFVGAKRQPPMVSRNPTSKAQAIRDMDASFDYGAAVINAFNDQTLMEVVQTNSFLGPSSRARVIWFLIGHTWDIYGQLVVYLRLNGGVPPASQRP
jgi:DinB family protein